MFPSSLIVFLFYFQYLSMEILAGTFMTGSEHNDEFYTDSHGRIRTRTNRSGGIQVLVMCFKHWQMFRIRLVMHHFLSICCL